MQIILNGQTRQTHSQTIGELLREIQFAPVGLAVALNQSVVRRADLETRALQDGDQIEIIRAVQGG